MADVIDIQDPDFQPLYADQTEDVILSRWVDWANEGLDPIADQDEWVDTREGSHWRTPLTPALREVARLYDSIGTEVVMAGMPLWTWGTYLDDTAAVWKILRLTATVATGVVTFTGPVGTVIGAGTTVTVTPASADAPGPEFEVTGAGGTIPAGGSIDLPVQATEAGSDGNVAAHAINAPSTPLPGITIDNAQPTSGGTDPEADDKMRERLLEAFEGTGPANRRAYVQEARNFPGVGMAFVVTTWNGPGTVLVVVTDPSGNPVSTATVDALQTYLDPTAGQGDGWAPPGAIVTVQTATLQDVSISATIVPEPGYSIDGFGGTVALQGPIDTRLAAYVGKVGPGDSVVLAHVAGVMATTPGVHDISNVKINGVAANLDLPAYPGAKVPAYIAPATLS